MFSNTAESGGGAYLNGPSWGGPNDPGALIEGNTVFSNTARDGGGLSLTCSAAHISGNLIHDNAADKTGGGLSLLLSSPTFQRNIIRANNAGDGGGGIDFQWGYPTLINNVIVDNHSDMTWGKGSGLHSKGANLNMSHNTIARNAGGDGSGLYVVDLQFGQPTVVMTNTILANQPVGISAQGVSTVTMNGILWYSTPITVSKSITAVVTVKNHYSGNPMFAADGYHLSFSSAAIDKGVNAGVTEDIDGESRPRWLGHDLGADEYSPKLVYLPLVRK